jgi:hypothetical protein
MIEVIDGLDPGETAVTPANPGNTLQDGHRITP